MDRSVPLDPAILSRTQPQLKAAAAVLAQPVGELAETLSVKAPPGRPSDVERLIAAAISEALAEHGLTIDGVFHGVFEDKHVFQAGPKTIADLWTILPYENFLVTGEFTPNELETIMDEVMQSRESRSLVGFQMALEGRGSARRLTSLRAADGRPLDPAKRYRIAFNTFDASSGGHRFIKLRDLLARPSAHHAFHPVQTREALIDYFRRHKTVHAVPRLAAAA
jgi:2',3'-cyclic-nucleotide 2'-phosphodiesterase (5'-nucleotidase family)